MPILDLVKPKADSSAKSAVPDELPPLPGTAPVQPTQAAQPQPAQQQAQSLAPDELPPLSAPQQPAATPQPVQQPVQPVSSPAAAPVSAAHAADAKPMAAVQPQTETDKRLYFSELISRFHNPEEKKTAEQEIINVSSQDVINHLSSNWEQQKKEERLIEIEKQINEKMAPMQSMEQQWRSLKSELDQRRQEEDTKTRKVQEIEETIRKTTEELKNLLNEKSRLNSELSRQG